MLQTSSVISFAASSWRTKTLCISTTLLLLAGCQTSSSSSLSPEQRNEIIVDMRPLFECAQYHDQVKDNEAVTKAIDEAVSVGESGGMSGNELLGQHWPQIKEDTRAAVLEKALELSSQREGALPRFDGSAQPPTPDEELRAWKELYEAQCTPSV